MSMRIENEMLSRFNASEASMASEISLSKELDFFFDNIMDTVVDYFKEKEEIKIWRSSFKIPQEGGLV